MENLNNKDKLCMACMLTENPLLTYC